MMRWRYNEQPVGNGWTAPANNGAFGADDYHRAGAVKADPYDNKRNETMYFYTDNDAQTQQLVGTLTDQSIADTVQRLKVELIGGLGRDELHGWALHSLADDFRISEVVLLSLRIGPHAFGRHQPGIVAKHLKLAAEMMRADAGLHADQAWWQVGKSRFDLAA
jgi:hypothetical protein